MAIELNGISNSLNTKVRGGAQGSGKDEKTLDTQPQSTEAAIGVEDRVQLSSHAQHLYKSEGDDSLDTGKVAALRQQIEDGDYTIDYKKLAGKLMALESKL